MTEAGDFWTAEEVATYFRLPQSTVYKLAQDKILPGFKVGKHWRFRREAILEWIKLKENRLSSIPFDNLKTSNMLKHCRQMIEPVDLPGER